MNQIVYFKDLGNKPYKDTWDFQEILLQKNVAIKTANRINNTYDATTNYLLFVEHPPVYTLGKNGKPEHVLLTNQELKTKGIEYFHINRGGDITFHGPEQLVGYPILDLDNFKTDLGWYLRNIEEVIIRTLKNYGIHGDRSIGETGVWLDVGVAGRERKICAIGIRCSRWVTMHGFAFNINTNLDYFNFIIPCGIQNKQVTSLQHELGKPVSMDEVKEKVLYYFQEIFDAEIVNTEISLNEKVPAV